MLTKYCKIKTFRKKHFLIGNKIQDNKGGKRTFCGGTMDEKLLPG